MQFTFASAKSKNIKKCFSSRFSFKGFRYHSQITPKLTPRELSQQTEVSYATGKEDEKVNTEEESDSVHSDPELDYDFNIDRTPRYKANQNRQDKRQVNYLLLLLLFYFLTNLLFNPTWHEFLDSSNYFIKLEGFYYLVLKIISC